MNTDYSYITAFFTTSMLPDVLGDSFSYFRLAEFSIFSI